MGEELGAGRRRGGRAGTPCTRRRRRTTTGRTPAGTTAGRSSSESQPPLLRPSLRPHSAPPSGRKKKGGWSKEFKFHPTDPFTFPVRPLSWLTLLWLNAVPRPRPRWRWSARTRTGGWTSAPRETATIPYSTSSSYLHSTPLSSFLLPAPLFPLQPMVSSGSNKYDSRETGDTAAIRKLKRVKEVMFAHIVIPVRPRANMLFISSINYEVHAN